MSSSSHAASSSSSVFEWPTSPPAHPSNLALPAKLCTTLIPHCYLAIAIPTSTSIYTPNWPMHSVILASSRSSHCFVSTFPPPPTTTTTVTTGWSSNDVILVTVYSNRFIVKLPRCSPGSTSSQMSRKCCAEGCRTAWAASHGFGPRVFAIDKDSGGFIMECIEGAVLETNTIRTQHLPQVINLLRRIHNTPTAAWMKRYDPVAVVGDQLGDANRREALRPEDARLLDSVVQDTKEAVDNHPWTPCHNDFHSRNIMMLKDGCLRAIDFEDLDSGDPMWDLAYLTVNLELEKSPDGLWSLYGAIGEEKRRLGAYVPLAMAHRATWAALRGGAWLKHQEELLERLRGVREV